MQYEVVLTANYKGIKQIFLSQRTFRKDHAEGIGKLIDHSNMELEVEIISVEEGNKKYRTEVYNEAYSDACRDVIAKIGELNQY